VQTIVDVLDTTIDTRGKATNEGRLAVLLSSTSLWFFYWELGTPPSRTLLASRRTPGTQP
jgi:hypothetical protein